MGRTYLFLLRAGCKAEHVRFRQHLPDEMAHYACDCWDAEIEMALGWVECVGVADRSAYDLTVHAKATNTALTASQPLEKPITVETYVLTKKALAGIGKAFKKDAKAVTAHLTSLSAEELKALEAAAKAAGKASVSVGGADFEIAAELIVCESKSETQHVEVFTPSVIEPSFGLDRILTAVYEHAFYVRDAKEGEAEEAKPKEEGKEGKKEKKKGKEEDKKAVAGVLGLPAEMAPYKVVVLPLDMRVAAQYADALSGTRSKLTEHGLQYKVDESGASIGRRYARADELGIPYAITIDFDTIGLGESDGDKALLGTATLRERDTQKQVRLPLSELPEILSKLCSQHPLSWADLLKTHGGEGAAAATPADPNETMVEYLNRHEIAAKLNEAVNAIGRDKPADPIAALIKHLSK